MPGSEFYFYNVRFYCSRNQKNKLYNELSLPRSNPFNTLSHLHIQVESKKRLSKQQDLEEKTNTFLPALQIRKLQK